MPEAHSIHQSTLERLAPGSALRAGLERIIQMGKGAIIVLGDGPKMDAISSGGFIFDQPVAYTPAKLSELAKMDGGIVLDPSGDHLIRSNVHFVPSNEIRTDETGSRHRTAQRIAIQTGYPVVAVSEGRKIVTVYFEDQKTELRSPTEIAARVNQELQTLDRLRRRLDEAEVTLTQLEMTGLVTYRAVVTLIQRSELVRRVGLSIEDHVVQLGDEGRLAYIQLDDMVRGVDHLRFITMRDYTSTRRVALANAALDRLDALEESKIHDPGEIGRALGFDELDEPVVPRGYRLLSKVGRLPESVREELVRHFKTLPRILKASTDQLESVEGIGSTRADYLVHYFDRLHNAAENWAPSAL